MPVEYRVPRTTDDDGVTRPHRQDEIDLPVAAYTFHYKPGSVHVESEDEIDVYENDDACEVLEKSLPDDDPDPEPEPEDETDADEETDDEDEDGDDGYPCDECDETFETEEELWGHRSAHSD